MTTDSEAWVQAWATFARALARQLNPPHQVQLAIAETLDDIRERQKRGDFGVPPSQPQMAHCSGPDCNEKAPGPSRLDAMEADTDKGLMLELLTGTAQECGRLRRERDNLQSLLNAERVKREQAEALVSVLRKDAANFMGQRDEQRARAEKAARLAEARADASFREKVAVVALLKEALGALSQTQWQDDLRSGGALRICACGRHEPEHAPGCVRAAVLSKARAAGYAVEGETPHTHKPGTGWCSECQQWACLDCGAVVPLGAGSRCESCIAKRVP